MQSGKVEDTTARTADTGSIGQTMADLAQVASTARDLTGRYFSLVSAVPSAFLVAWAVLLTGSGAWSGAPDAAAALRTFKEAGIGGAVGLTLAAVGIGIVMHPIQFAFVQFLEGYWGAGPIAQRVRRLRAAAHWTRVRRLRGESAATGRRIESIKAKTKGIRGDARRQLEAEIAELQADRREFARLTENYPRSREAFMPTRLGNVLRHHEWTAGMAYGIEPISAAPYLLSVAKSSDLEYLDDQRSQLDLAARMTVVSLIASAMTAMIMLRHGAWLLLTLVPYGAAYASYRGAVVAAAEYGRALGVVLTLNRFALYDQLQIRRPADTDSERRQNDKLMLFLRHTDTDDLTLEFDPSTNPAAGVPRE